MNNLNKLDRVKIFITHLIISGVFDSQKTVGVFLGYNNESSFSQILTKKTPIPKNFINKLKKLEPTLNINWIETGEGEMFDSNKITGNSIYDNKGNVSQIVGNGNKIATGDRRSDDMQRLLSIIEKKDDQIAKIHEQMDRLISLLEKK